MGHTEPRCDEAGHGANIAADRSVSESPEAQADARSNKAEHVHDSTHLLAGKQACTRCPESLIAHLLFPQKISRSSSSDISNYLVRASAKS